MLHVAQPSSDVDDSDIDDVEHDDWEDAPLLLSWRTHAESKKSPAPRKLHAAAIYNSHMYVCGGQDSEDSIYADFFSYDVKREQWKEHPPMRVARSAHFMFAMTLDDTNEPFLVVGGGCFGEQQEDEDSQSLLEGGIIPEIFHLPTSSWVQRGEEDANKKGRGQEGIPPLKKWRRSPQTLVRTVRQRPIVPPSLNIDGTADFSAWGSAKMATEGQSSASSSTSHSSGSFVAEHVEMEDHSMRYLCSAVCRSGKKGYLFGGLNELEEGRNDLVTVELVTEATVGVGERRQDHVLLRLESPQCTGECPGSVYGHAAALSESTPHMFIYSGKYPEDDVASFELYQLHLETYVWRILKLGHRDVPPERLMFGLVACGGGKYLVALGGQPPNDDDGCDDDYEEEDAVTVVPPFAACLTEEDSEDCPLTTTDAAAAGSRPKSPLVTWRKIVMQEGVGQNNVNGFTLLCLDHDLAGPSLSDGGVPSPPTPNSTAASIYSHSDDVLLSSYIMFGGRLADVGETNSVVSLDVVYRALGPSGMRSMATEETAVPEESGDEEDCDEEDEEEEEEEDDAPSVTASSPDAGIGYSNSTDVNPTPTSIATPQRPPQLPPKRDSSGGISGSTSSACMLTVRSSASSMCSRDPPPCNDDDMIRKSTDSSSSIAAVMPPDAGGGTAVEGQPSPLSIAEVMAQSMERLQRSIEHEFVRFHDRLGTLERCVTTMQQDLGMVKTKVERLALDGCAVPNEQRLVNNELLRRLTR